MVAFHPDNGVLWCLFAAAAVSDYEKGKTITGIENLRKSIAFHAGTVMENGVIKSNGGRVIAVTSYGENFKDALKQSYKNVEKINFDKKYYRTDLGFDL